jgi:hypothetical protein
MVDFLSPISQLEHAEKGALRKKRETAALYEVLSTPQDFICNS